VLHSVQLLDIATVILIGAGATLLVDAWNHALKRVLGVPSLSYCLLGRWVAHLRHGVIRHRSIGAAAAIRFECAIGWMAHYAIGIGLAGAFGLWLAPGWLTRPTLAPALLYGVATVALPFFVLQPALGLGVASAATRRPTQARLKSLATHAAYGVGLYVVGHVAAHMRPF
jgi:hypothetical protein